MYEIEKREREREKKRNKDRQVSIQQLIFTFPGKKVFLMFKRIL